VEAARLHALIDGLTLHSIADPRTDDDAMVRAVLELYLSELQRPPASN